MLRYERTAAFRALVIAGVLSGATAGTSAFAEAADLGPYKQPARTPAYIPPQPPPPPPVYGDATGIGIWNGAYYGLSVGYGFGRTDFDFARANHGSAFSEPEGALGAVTLGFNHQLPSGLLIGLEGDLGIMDLSADNKTVLDGHVFESNYGTFWGTIRGRLGFAIGTTLLYGTGGAAFMDLDEKVIGNTAAETAVNEDFKTGFVVGGGIEQALGRNMTLKIEYLHMDFGSFDGVSVSNDAFSFENKVDLVRAGLNYKF